MRYLARLRSMRADVNPLQLTSYSACPTEIDKWARLMLAGEPPGAAVDIYELVQVARRTFIKREEKDHVPVIEKIDMPARDHAGAAAVPAELAARGDESHAGEVK